MTLFPYSMDFFKYLAQHPIIFRVCWFCAKYLYFFRTREASIQVFTVFTPKCSPGTSNIISYLYMLNVEIYFTVNRLRSWPHHVIMPSCHGVIVSSYNCFIISLCHHVMKSPNHHCDKLKDWLTYNIRNCRSASQTKTLDTRDTYCKNEVSVYTKRQNTEYICCFILLN